MWVRRESFHEKLWLIDHGASLYFHHGWGPATALSEANDPFVEVKDHVLLSWAGALEEASAHLRATFDEACIRGVVSAVPDAWLAVSSDPRARDFPDASTQREAYVSWLTARVHALPTVLAEASDARAKRV